jgi:hypothetical protein
MGDWQLAIGNSLRERREARNHPIVVSQIAARDGWIQRWFATHSIPLISGSTPVTTRFVNVYEGEIRRQEAPCLANPIRFVPVLPLIKYVTHVHLGPLHLNDLHPGCLTFLSHYRHMITLDVQGYVRKVCNRRIVPTVSKHLARALHLAHIVKAGSEEMVVILEKYRMDLRGFQTFFQIDELLVTSGRRGGFVRMADGARVNFSAYPVNHEVDATGAGDVLFAAYLVKRVYHRLSIKASIQYAAQVAADQVAGRFVGPETLLI